MRLINLLNFYFIKTIELMFLIGLTAAIIYSTYSLAQYEKFYEEYPDGEKVVRQLIGISVLAVFHTLHNNFLSNLRLACREKSAYFAFCWAPVNYCIGKFGRGD
jgi:putative effector of murein hydrolase